MINSYVHAFRVYSYAITKLKPNRKILIQIMIKSINLKNSKKAKKDQKKTKKDRF